MIQCKICSKSFNSLGSHIRVHNMTTKEYYDLYLKQPNEDKCIICNNQTQFIDMTKGYKNKCEEHVNHFSIKNKIQYNVKKCIICGYTRKKLKNHINKTHNLTEQEYYDKYLKRPNEDICPVCGKNTNFINMYVGYREHCSTKCSSLDLNVQSKNKATNMKLYNVEHNWNKGELRKHQEATMLKKYGVKHNWQSSKLRSKENFKVSKLEQYFIDKLEELNIDYDYRYFDESGQYPYECDFYLKDTNTFIEINGTGLHDTHIFDPNNKKDIEQLEYIKSRTDSSWYQSKLRIWLKDKEKYDTAIKNKLNYYILWNTNDIDNFCNKL